MMRFGPHVERSRHGSLEEALDALGSRIPHVSRRDDVRALVRDYEPVQQVAGRLEVHGPRGVRGGVDVRGDGSAEAYTGWIRKRLVELQPGESPVDALRRSLASPSSS
ncbi:MAG: hypothetical protein M3320_01065 [Actinomycetota bacterium]|nr:hypothetical protein [Actinomycetota bacterium]